MLNQLVETKLAAMSSKPQTTRNRITGVVHLPGGQIILLDTPGIHPARSALNQMMVKTSVSTFRDVDVIVFMVDAQQGFRETDSFVFDSMEKVTAPILLALNKIDRASKHDLLSVIAEMDAKKRFAEIIPISALHADGLDILSKVILNYLPEGPPYFPEGMITDSPEEFLIAEIIREKLMNLTRMEIPYASAVKVESVIRRPHASLRIDAVVYVEKLSQKKIVIGENASMLKKIGKNAREEIEKRFGDKVYLNLFVKVKSHWSENLPDLKELGYTHDIH